MSEMEVIRVDGRYRIKERVGSGTNSTVYRSQDIFTGAEFAIKLEPIWGETISCLEHEYEILNRLQNGTTFGVPRPIWFGREGKYRAMVLESLGPSLQTLFSQSANLFNLSQVAKIGLQMISRLEYVHSCDLVHRDIKPHNILTGIGESLDSLFLIDFGLAQQYRDSSSRIHISPQENLSFVGTPAFASVNSHRGLQLARRDDVESLAFSLIFLHRGSLPWLTSDGRSPSRSSIFDLKQKFLSKHDTGAHDVPNELASIFHHARSLTFAQRPDYIFLRTVLEAAAEQSLSRYPLDSHSTASAASPPPANILASSPPTPRPTAFTSDRKTNKAQSRKLCTRNYNDSPARSPRESQAVPLRRSARLVRQ